MTVSPLGSPGAPRSYEEFYDHYFPRVRMLLIRHFTTCDAEEVAQEAMTRCYVKFDELREGCDPWPWVSSVARNAAIDSMRRTSRLVCTDELPEPPGSAADTTYEAVLVSERARLVRLALSRLRPADRRLIEDRELEGLGFTQMAAVRDVSENTVRQQLHRARQRLHVELRRVGANLGVVPVAVQVRLTRLSRRFNDLSAGAGPVGASALSMAAVAGVATVATFVAGHDAPPAPTAAPLVSSASDTAAATAPAGTTRTRVAPADTRGPSRIAPARPAPAAPAPKVTEPREDKVGPVTISRKGDPINNPHEPYEAEGQIDTPVGPVGLGRLSGEAMPGSGLLCYLKLRPCPREAS